MTVKTFTPKNIEELKTHINRAEPSFYHTSQTSTVIPYDRIQESLDGLTIVNLGLIPTQMSMEGDDFVCRGPVTWKDAKEFCQSHNRQIMTYPTEELAGVLAGVATSCTGERCFGFGTLREQIVSLKYLDQDGNEIELNASKDLSQHSLFLNNQDIFNKYQSSYQSYASFKNAPFPRLVKETDLLTGTEGQLGIVTEVRLKTTSNSVLKYLFFAFDPWEKGDEAHLELFEKVQPFRNMINSCELIDSNSLSYLEDEMVPVKGKDLIFLEIFEEHFEEIYEQLLSQLSHVNDDEIFEMSGSKFHQLRVTVPRAIFEVNSQMGVVKKGTDVQVKLDNFKDLLQIYREFSKSGIRYNLFGHFGDAHLHFNFMPNKDQVDQCQSLLEDMYKQVLQLQGSPFAEHGIGLIKQKFIQPFWQQEHKDMFSFLKNNLDKNNIFFPKGYMSL